MTAIQIDGKWFAIEGRVIGPFTTNADAWRWIDHHDGEPVFRSENIAPQLWNEADK